MDDQRTKRTGGMDASRQDALVAILERIDEQTATLGTMMCNPLSDRERVRISDEVAYLKIERKKAADMLKKLH